VEQNFSLLVGVLLRVGVVQKPLLDNPDFNYNDDNYVHNFLIAKSKKNKRSLETEENKKKAVALQEELLKKVTEFTTSNKCHRRKILGTEDKSDLLIREDCCDRCKFDLNYNVPLHQLYEGIEIDGTCDVDEEARIILNTVICFIYDPTIPQLVALLQGETEKSDLKELQPSAVELYGSFPHAERLRCLINQCTD
jgi:hypothetical protein